MYVCVFVCVCIFVAVSFRGCSGEDNLTPGGYHLGFTKDIRYIAEKLHEQTPDKKIFLTGNACEYIIR